MRWGNIRDQFKGFAWKRLSDHEVDPKVSNGHEFQGVNALREILGSERKPEIPTDYYLIGDDMSDRPAVVKVIPATASWYDSREKDNNRSAEWRLYYPAPAGSIQKLCKPKDLMIMGLRTSGRLAVFLISKDTCAEAAFINLLQIRDSDRPHGTFILNAREGDIGAAAAELIEQLAQSMEAFDLADIPPPISLPEPSPAGDTEVKIIAERMCSIWPQKLGSCKEVEELVFETAGIREKDMQSDPDSALVRWLEIAEGAYRIWEDAWLTGYIGPLRHDPKMPDNTLAEKISTVWMSLRQSRVSRAGTMMELFLCRILDASKLRYERGASIEGGKLPDFVFPGAKEYADKSFPQSGLRILGAKTSLKDRWRQILAEGDRVEKKHGVTRDISVTRKMFQQMHKASFYVVVPEPLRKQYMNPSENLINLEAFISEVRQSQGEQPQSAMV